MKVNLSFNPVLNVTPVQGELLSAHVASRTEDGVMYLSRWTENKGLGFCSCPNWEFGRQPLWRVQQLIEPSMAFFCWHQRQHLMALGWDYVAASLRRMERGGEIRL